MQNCVRRRRRARASVIRKRVIKSCTFVDERITHTCVVCTSCSQVVENFRGRLVPSSYLVYLNVVCAKTKKKTKQKSKIISRLSRHSARNERRAAAAAVAVVPGEILSIITRHSTRQIISRLAVAYGGGAQKRDVSTGFNFVFFFSSLSARENYTFLPKFFSHSQSTFSGAHEHGTRPLLKRIWSFPPFDHYFVL